MHKKDEFTANVGDQLVIWITGRIEKFIAEVTKAEPLRLKVMENGPYANLKEGDYLILPKETIAWQKGGTAKQMLLHTSKRLDRPVVSGLTALGVKDGILHELLPLK